MQTNDTSTTRTKTRAQEKTPRPYVIKHVQVKHRGPYFRVYRTTLQQHPSRPERKPPPFPHQRKKAEKKAPGKPGRPSGHQLFTSRRQGLLLSVLCALHYKPAHFRDGIHPGDYKLAHATGASRDTIHRQLRDLATIGAVTVDGWTETMRGRGGYDAKMHKPIANVIRIQPLGWALARGDAALVPWLLKGPTLSQKTTAQALKAGRATPTPSEAPTPQAVVRLPTELSRGVGKPVDRAQSKSAPNTHNARLLALAEALKTPAVALQAPQGSIFDVSARPGMAAKSTAALIASGYVVRDGPDGPMWYRPECAPPAPAGFAVLKGAPFSSALKPP